VEVLRLVRHERIVHFLGFVHEPAQLCLVFELCVGSCAQLLRCVRRELASVTLRVLLGMARDAAEAVHYLHRQRPPILHRDLKADNLLLTKDFRVKLTDFGLSRTYEDQQKMTVCGTPCWVAPEIFLERPYDEKVDVYSLGILLWEIFSAQKPYDDQDCAQLPQLVSSGLRPAPLAHCPEELGDLMSKCWADDPARRPGFAAVCRRLDEVVHAVKRSGKFTGCPAHPPKKRGSKGSE